MAAVSHRYKLVYFPIPKNASSSLKRLFYTLDAGRTIDETFPRGKDRPGVHQIYRSWPGDWQPYYGAYTSMVVVRDPIKRLLSAFANRFLEHLSLERQQEKLQRAKLNPDPGLEEFLHDFTRYREKLKLLRNHTIPQTTYVGAFWDKITIRLPIERLGELPALIAEATGQQVTLPARNPTKKPFAPADIPPRAFDALVEFYREDYEMLKDLYSPEMLR